MTDDELEYLTPYVSKMLLRLTDADDQSSGSAEAWNDVPVEENMVQGSIFILIPGYTVQPMNKGHSREGQHN